MIRVIAGVNGAGKSSVAGAHIRAQSGDYFNPDEVARELMAASPGLSQRDANSRAWHIGYEQLQRAISEEACFTYETTLGGNQVCRTLHEAIDRGGSVAIFFVGLESPELHIQRVAERVARGGHAIPEADIRRRWKGALRNMVGLIPRCAAITVVDNSRPMTGGRPNPRVVFRMRERRFTQMPDADTPDWAKPLASVAMQVAQG